MNTRAIPLVLALAFAGCYRPQIEDCRVRCGDGLGCPSGFGCSEGLCRPTNPTSGNGCADLPDGAVDAFDPACVGVVCDDSPPPTCNGNNLTTFARPGTCIGGTCSYPPSERVCVGACTAGRCTGAWSTLSQQNAPSARFAHTTVWTGTELIMWGGGFSSTGSAGDGARYNLSTGQWTPISSVNAPSARRSHSAVWTGTEMIVWGGSAITQGTPFADGGRYRPATDSWMPLASTGAPAARFGHSAVWTGTRMIVWAGGTASTSSLSDGAIFDPTTSTWSPLPGTHPGPRRDHSAVWTGTRMLVWGGSTIYAGGGGYADVVAYDPIAGAWTTVTTTGTPPSSRFSHAAVWTGSEMLIFGGGVSSTGTLGDGSRLDLASSTWSPMPTTGQPSGRRQLPAIWTGDSMILWGGSTIVDGSTLPTDAFRFQTYVP
ncbi:MAG: hypothetical protein M4D80_15615 [Myxococcota bacterium]|nr:hypothetical protein [Myxococcota bacterium]